MKIELKSIHHSEQLSQETNAFSATLYINDFKAGTATNQGHGGPTDYYGFNERGNQLIREAEEYCKTLPSEKFTAGGKEYTIDSTLEIYIDNLLQKHLEQKDLQKFRRQVDRAMEKSIVIADGGQRIETHNIGRNQSEKARKEIEIEYGLIKAEDQNKEMAYMLKPVSLEKIEYGKTATKAAISAIVREVTGSYKFTSLPELNAALRQFNVLADRGTPGTGMYENKGLVYSILDEHGKKVGVPIKASSIYSSPTIKNLEKKFAPNDTARKPYGQRLKHLLDKAIATARNNAELKAQLQAQGIRILLHENVQGNVYGVTFIDNATRVVYNGSDLGKAYGAKAFMARLPMGAATEKQQPEINLPGTILKSIPAEKKNYPAHDQPVIQRLIDIAFRTRSGQSMPDPFRRKKKRRLLAG